MVRWLKIGILVVGCAAISSSVSRFNRASAAEIELVEKTFDVKDLAPSAGAGETLAECVFATVAPNDWDSVGGHSSIKYRRGELAISAPADVQAKIEELLDALRKQPAAGSKEAKAAPKTPRVDVQGEKDSGRRLVVYPMGDFLQAFGSTFSDDQVIELITSTVATSSWSEVGGDGCIREFEPRSVLVVEQSKEAITQLDALFAALRKAPMVEKKMLDKPPATPAIAAGSFESNDLKLTTVVYPVADLISDGKTIWRSERKVVGPFGSDSYEGQQNYEFDSLIEPIASTVYPNTWDAVGGQGTIRTFDQRLALVISQTAEAHQQVAALLAALRKIPRHTADAAKTKPQSPSVVGEYKSGDLVMQIVVYDVGRRILTSDKNADYEALMESLSNIARDSWDINGGVGTFKEFVGRGALVVTNTKQNQTHIAKFIEIFKPPKD